MSETEVSSGWTTGKGIRKEVSSECGSEERKEESQALWHNHGSSNGLGTEAPQEALTPLTEEAVGVRRA